MIYIIKPGDTLSEIAVRHGVPMKDILRANPSIVDANKIYAGRSLEIPGFIASPVTDVKRILNWDLWEAIKRFFSW